MIPKFVSVHVALSELQHDRQVSMLSELRSAGLEDASLLDEIGLVTGRIAEDRLDALRRLPGMHVEVDDVVDIGPPGSSETW